MLNELAKRNAGIRSRVAQGEKQCDIARELGLTTQRISQIVHHVPVRRSPAPPRTRHCTTCCRTLPATDFERYARQCRACDGEHWSQVMGGLKREVGHGR